MRDVKRMVTEHDVAGLIDLLAHPKKGVRSDAAAALGVLADGSCIASLTGMLAEEPEASVRETISTALRPFDDEAVVAALAARVGGDASESVRSAAAWSLIGKRKDTRACDALIAVLVDQSVKCSVRRDTALALGAPPYPAAAAAIERLLRSKKNFREEACWSTLSVAPTLALWESQNQEWSRLFEANITDSDELLFTMNLGDTIGAVALADRWVIGWHRNRLTGIKDPNLQGWVVRYGEVGAVEYSPRRGHDIIDFKASVPGLPLRFTYGHGIRDVDQAAPFLDWLNRRNEALQRG